MNESDSLRGRPWLTRARDFGAEALGVNERLAAVNPRDAATWNRLTMCYIEARQFEEALGACRNVLALEPGNSIVRNRLADLERRAKIPPCFA